MKNEKLLTVQDISCVGQCSLTVALPILSACGVETCVLPSALLSTHTAFSHFTCLDLTAEMDAIRQAWEQEQITFGALYTGYLGSIRQIAEVKRIADACIQSGGLRIVDPAMADGGKLYPAFDMDFVAAMRELCRSADILLPNITEACLLSDTPYRERYDRAYIDGLLVRLRQAVGDRTVILTGVGFCEDRTGVLISKNGETDYYEHRRLSRSCHGTGDVYASVFTGAVLRGETVERAARLAADFTVSCIENTADDPAHWYGVKFEGRLPELIQALEKDGQNYERDLRR